MLIPNIHIFELVVPEKVLEEAVIILLVFIIIVINPAQVLQGNDVVAFIYVSITIQISQICALIHGRYFNTLCR